MIATVPFIKKTFIEFNKKFFNNELPMVNFKISRTKRSLGDYSPTENRIRVSGLYDNSKTDIENTILHEMCHHWQYVNYGYCDHGYSFYKIAEKINKIDPAMHIARCGDNKDVKPVVNNNKIEDVLIWTNTAGIINISKIDKNYIQKYLRLLIENKHDTVKHIQMKENSLTFQLPKSRKRLSYISMSRMDFKNNIVPFVIKSHINEINSFI